MRTNLRSIFGYVTIVCILLAIFRRVILLGLDDSSVGFWHCVCAPWYADLYLLGLEGFWGFEGAIDDLTKYDNTWRDWYLLTVLFSIVAWLAVHVVAATYAGFAIYDLFFRPAQASTGNSEVTQG